MGKNTQFYCTIAKSAPIHVSNDGSGKWNAKARNVLSKLYRDQLGFLYMAWFLVFLHLPKLMLFLASAFEVKQPCVALNAGSKAKSNIPHPKVRINRGTTSRAAISSGVEPRPTPQYMVNTKISPLRVYDGVIAYIRGINAVPIFTPLPHITVHFV